MFIFTHIYCTIFRYAHRCELIRVMRTFPRFLTKEQLESFNNLNKTDGTQAAGYAQSELDDVLTKEQLESSSNWNELDGMQAAGCAQSKPDDILIKEELDSSSDLNEFNRMLAAEHAQIELDYMLAMESCYAVRVLGYPFYDEVVHGAALGASVAESNRPEVASSAPEVVSSAPEVASSVPEVASNQPVVTSETYIPVKTIPLNGHLVTSTRVKKGVLLIDLQKDFRDITASTLESALVHLRRLDEANQGRECEHLSMFMHSGIGSTYPESYRGFMHGHMFSLPLNKIWGSKVRDAVQGVLDYIRKVRPKTPKRKRDS